MGLVFHLISPTHVIQTVLSGGERVSFEVGEGAKEGERKREREAQASLVQCIDPRLP